MNDVIVMENAIEKLGRVFLFTYVFGQKNIVAFDISMHTVVSMEVYESLK